MKLHLPTRCHISKLSRSCSDVSKPVDRSTPLTKWDAMQTQSAGPSDQTESALKGAVCLHLVFLSMDCQGLEFANVLCSRVQVESLKKVLVAVLSVKPANKNPKAGLPAFGGPVHSCLSMILHDLQQLCVQRPYLFVSICDTGPPSSLWRKSILFKLRPQNLETGL